MFWQMLTDAINDIHYQIDGVGCGMWIYGPSLNRYRRDHPAYHPIAHGGWDWFEAAKGFRKRGQMLKFSIPNGRVFFVLPQFQVQFEGAYPLAHVQ